MYFQTRAKRSVTDTLPHLNVVTVIHKDHEQVVSPQFNVPAVIQVVYEETLEKL